MRKLNSFCVSIFLGYYSIILGSKYKIYLVSFKTFWPGCTINFDACLRWYLFFSKTRKIHYCLIVYMDTPFVTWQSSVASVHICNFWCHTNNLSSKVDSSKVSFLYHIWSVSQRSSVFLALGSTFLCIWQCGNGLAWFD